MVYNAVYIYMKMQPKKKLNQRDIPGFQTTVGILLQTVLVLDWLDRLMQIWPFKSMVEEKR